MASGAVEWRRRSRSWVRVHAGTQPLVESLPPPPLVRSQAQRKVVEPKFWNQKKYVCVYSGFREISHGNSSDFAVCKTSIWHIGNRRVRWYLTPLKMRHICLTTTGLNFKVWPQKGKNTCQRKKGYTFYGKLKASPAAVWPISTRPFTARNLVCKFTEKVNLILRMQAR